MPPQLALILCTGFVLYLLRYDRKLSPDVSQAVLLPNLWLFSIATKPFGVWFPSASGDEYGSTWDQYFLISLLVLGLGVLARRQFNWSDAIRKHSWLFLLIGYMLASTFWSDLEFTGIKRLIRQFVAVVMAFVVLSEKNPRQTVECLLRRSAYVLIPFSMLLIKYYPYYGVEFHQWSGDRMWIGVSQQKNGLARVCIIALLFLGWDLFRRWKGRMLSESRNHTRAEVAVLMLGLYLFLLPDGKASATSTAAFALALATLWGLSWLRRHHIPVSFHALTLIVLSLIVIGISLPVGGNRIGGGISEAMGRDASLTGRADTWAEIVPIAMSHPILGCGFDSYWTPITRELHKMSNSHNSYLDLFNELGALGLVAFSLYTLSIARTAHMALALDRAWGELCIAYLLMALVHGMAESSITSFTGHLLGTLLLLQVSCSSIRDNSKSRYQYGPTQSETL
jgi:exopolysaccharide production protein ExoQ